MCFLHISRIVKLVQVLRWGLFVWGFIVEICVQKNIFTKILLLGSVDEVLFEFPVIRQRK